MKNLNTNKNIDIMEVGIHTVNVALRTIYNKTANEYIRELRNDLFNLKKEFKKSNGIVNIEVKESNGIVNIEVKESKNDNVLNTSSSNAIDLINHALYAIYYFYTKTKKAFGNCTFENFLKDGKHYKKVNVKIKYKNGNVKSQLINAFTYALRQVNKLIYSNKSNKGALKITNKKIVNVDPCKVYKDGKLLAIIEDQYVEYESSYAIQLESINVIMEHPNNFHKLSYEHNLIDSIYKDDLIQLIKEHLNPKEQKIFDLMYKRYTQKEISKMLNIKINTVYSHVKRIRDKVANIDHFKDNTIIKFYNNKKNNK